MRISDWSSDVCSSDLAAIVRLIGNIIIVFPLLRPAAVPSMWHCRAWRASIAAARLETAPESVCIVTSDSFGGSARQRRKAGPRIESGRSEEHTSELQSLMRISYAVFCLKKKKKNTDIATEINQ